MPLQSLLSCFVLIREHRRSWSILVLALNRLQSHGLRRWRLILNRFGTTYSINPRDRDLQPREDNYTS